MVSKQLAQVRGRGSSREGKHNGQAADPLLDAPLCRNGHTIREMAAAARAKRPVRTENVEPKNISPGLIDASPYQPRRDFGAENLAALAATIEEHGLIEPLVVRPKGDRYELLAGERRLRAVLKAGLTQVRCEIRDATDAEARAVVILENLQRKDLNAIEEAIGYKQLLDAGDYPTQQALADHLGVSQPHVANRLRLLELPAEWQKRIISGEMSATHARQILPFKGHPKLLGDLGKELKKRNDEEPLSADDVEAAIDGVLWRHTRPLNKHEYSGLAGGSVPPLKPTEEQRKDLDLIHVPAPGGKTESRALNVKLFDKLWKAHRATWEATQKHKKRSEAARTGRATKKELTPAEKRAAAKAAAEEYRRKISEFRDELLRCEISRAILTEGFASTGQFIRVLLAAANYGDWSMSQRMAELCKSAGIRVAAATKWRANIFVTLLAGEVSDNDVDRLARQWIASLFYDEKHGPSEDLEAAELPAIAAALDVDLEACWLDHQAGPLSERYWELHDKEQLLALAKELKVKEITAEMGKEAIVETFLARIPAEGDDASTAGDKSIDLPKELRLNKSKRAR
ncbi:MAG: ParB/RepB/Spo0J family partition protein [Phycisphaerae bacterium]|nr:ParB/RepB/Spo0J family partition protein [Phycisphaerae bacterium]